MIKKILNYTLFFNLFLCCFIVDVSAASYTGFDFTAQLYDNLGPSLSSVTTSGPTAGEGAYEGYIAYNANSSGGAWGISSPTTLLKNHTYTLTASIPNECGSLVLSTYNRIGVGTSLSNAKTSYQNNTNVNEVYSKVIGGNNFLIQFAFTPTINGSYIVFPFATNKTCSSSRTLLSNISIDDLGINGVTQDEINSSLNQQTTTITENITNMGEDIKDNIKDTFENCRTSKNLFNPATVVSGYISNDTGELRSGDASSSAYVSVNGNTSYYITPIASGNWGAWYDSNNVFISGISGYGVLKSPSNAKYLRVTVSYAGSNPNYATNFMIAESSVKIDYEAYGEEICQNKIDETNDKLDNINGTLTDDSSIDISTLEDSIGWLPPGPVDSILNLPLALFNSLSNNLSNKTCISVNLKLPFVNKNITLPCIKTLYDKMGVTGTLFQTTGIIASCFILFNYLLNLYHWIDKTLTLRENTMPGYYEDNWGGGA